MEAERSPLFPEDHGSRRSMNTTIEHDRITAPHPVGIGPDTVAALWRAIEAERRSGHGSRASSIRQVRVPLPSLDPLDWLRAQPMRERMYWSGRDGGEAWAAAGRAHAVAVTSGDPLDAVRDALGPLLAQAPEGVRYTGGMRFDLCGHAGPEWRPFGRARFTLPRFVVENGPVGSTLGCNLIFPFDADHFGRLREEVLQLVDPPAISLGALPLPVEREDEPGRAAWGDTVVRALGSFDRDVLEKIVLARTSHFAFSERLDAFLLLQRLQQATPCCFHFGFQFEPEVAFIGASPERLYRREGRQIQSEAVAGTRPRGTSPEQDAALRDELKGSEKDRREQGYVRRSILEALESICTSVAAGDEPRVMELAKGRHLWTELVGTLNDGVDDADIIRALHPTPAVGGYPRRQALDEIRRLERFDRGWYAGPVGWIGADRAEFAVGIRSGRVLPNDLTLYAGAGIVRGSEAEKEWAEIEHKISDFLNVLDLDLRVVEY
jgi:menaquinone-specific isochorismate synthase